MRQVHFAFHPGADGRWSGSHGTYAVQAGADGLALTPFHAPAAPQALVRGAPLKLGAARIRRGG
ncbi:hypothetical protein, partial [Hyalangium sp.]|uniref:hypothetical protein n=1 Tax=Hyalangium sp. TaxID=2028555 RepID=UPI002D228695